MWMTGAGWGVNSMCNEQVADTFLSGLEGAAQSCINSLPSLNGAPETTAITDQLNKCCPVIKKVRALPGLAPIFYSCGVYVCGFRV